MSSTLKQYPRKYPPLQFRPDIKPVEARYSAVPTGQAAIVLSNGNESPASCIRCPDSPCIRRSPVNSLSDFGSLFPADQNQLVCPVDAIHWPLDSSAPEINDEKCISCGICIVSCPVSAIFFTDSELPRVAEEPSDYLIEGNASKADRSVKNVGQIYPNLSQLLTSVYKGIHQNRRYGGANFPNILTRNLLTSLGINAMTRRQGDTNIRMDILLDDTKLIGVAEVEFDDDVLNSPRNLLDNIAVLSARYEVAKESIVPAVFTLSLPNVRSEYWQVLADINNVLGIKISTMSIGVLVLLLARNAKISISDLAEYYIDSDHRSLRAAASQSIGMEIDFPDGFLGILEPQK